MTWDLEVQLLSEVELLNGQVIEFPLLKVNQFVLVTLLKESMA